MTRLADLQSGFSAALLDSTLKPPDDLTSHSSERIDARFAVYRRNVMASLIQTLEARFPVVARLLGAEFFRAMASRHVVQSPPATPALGDYGGAFPDFVRNFAPVADLPYLADVARLEWLQHEAYHAADAEPLPPERLAELTAEQIPRTRLAFHPSLRLLASPFPVIAIWRTNTHDAEVVPIDLAAGGEDALILRPHLDVEINRLPAGAHDFIADLRVMPLGTAVDRARSRSDHFDLQAILAGLFASGAIVGTSLAD